MRKIFLSSLLPAFLFLSLSVSIGAKPVKVRIDNTQTGPTISKDVYAQFAEHLGHGIYSGIYVGKDSDIPNTNGFRKDVIKALKELQVPLVRWPGGCFADEYHWRDGIGPKDQRPVKVNTHWGGVEEDNSFGTHEFFELVELIGAEAYINGNLGSGSVQEMAEWLEYMTSDTNSSLVQERRKNGRDDPWEIAYFGIGNESWGCGGNMSPEYYSDLYRRYETFLKTPPGKRPRMVASGAYGELTTWTDVLSKTIDHGMAGISHHYYTLPKGNWEDKGTAIGFPESEWISTFLETKKIDRFIKDNVTVLDKNDPEKKLGFYVDEWGTWYAPEPGREPGFLWQRNTIRDALVAAVNLNIFHDYAERVRMTNIAQMVNVLQAMILTEDEKMLLTPTYHVFHMYKVFQDAEQLSLSTNRQPLYEHDGKQTEALSFSAARGQDGKLYLAITNIDPHKSYEIFPDLKKGKIGRVVGRSLHAEKMDAENTFNKPKQVTPENVSHKFSTGALTAPPKSVMVVELIN